jgi:aldose 1-epimerase
MFEIVEEIKNGLNCVIIKNIDTNECVSIVPGYGASVNEITLRKGEKLFPVLDGNISKDSFKGKDIFKGAKLFPFVNRIRGGCYSFNGTTYQLDVNYPEEGNAVHGFVYKEQFTLGGKIIEETSASAILKYGYHETFTGYPFKFSMELCYTLDKSNGFSCKTKITNTGEQSLPFGDGWHPFISFNKNVGELYLKIPEADLIKLDENLIPTGCFEPYFNFNNSSLIGNTQFDNCFYLKPVENKHCIELYDSQQDVRISLWQDAGEQKYNYLQIYIPPARKSIAIEPMTGNINSFNNGEGLLILEPGKNFTANYGLKIQ